MPQEHLVTCPFCSLHCADVRLTVDGYQLVGVSPACPTSQREYTKRLAHLAVGAAAAPDQKALREASAWIQNAHQVMMILCGDVHQEAASAAVDLAIKTRSALVGEENVSGSLLTMAMAEAGYLTATLGELSPSIDLVVFAGVAPASIPPRLQDQLGSDRLARAIHLTSPDPVALIQELRLANRGLTSFSTPASTRIQQAGHGLVLFDSTWMKDGVSTAIELLRWLDELNIEQRWYALYLPPSANSLGVVETLLSSTGYPGNMQFSLSGVHYDPRTINTEKYLLQGRADVCLVIGDPTGLSEPIRQALSQIKTILISSQPTDWQPDLMIPVAGVGLDGTGTMTRLDGVPLRIRGISPSLHPGIEDILSHWAQELGIC